VPGWHIPSFFFHHLSKAVTKFELLLGLFTLIKEISEIQERKKSVLQQKITFFSY
jgi:hypothetical protein